MLCRILSSPLCQSVCVVLHTAQDGSKPPNESNVSMLRPRKWPITGARVQADTGTGSPWPSVEAQQRPSLPCVMPSLPGLQAAGGCRPVTGSEAGFV